MDGHYYYKQGWLATGNSQGVVGVTFTSIPMNCEPSTDKLPLRTNYNLRNHHAKVSFLILIFYYIIFIYYYKYINNLL